MRKMLEADRVKNQEGSGLRLEVCGYGIPKDKALCCEKKNRRKDSVPTDSKTKCPILDGEMH